MMKNVYTILLVFIFSISLLVFPSDSEAQSDIIIGGFDLSRGGIVSFPEGDVFDEARLSLGENFSGVLYNSFSSLTTETLSGIDILIISSVQGLPATALAEPLTPDEQAALLEFVQTGGCAMLLTDSDGFDQENESLIDAFGMDSSGTFAGVDTAVVTNPLDSSVTNGPFGTIQLFVQNWPGAISNLGPYAVSLAQNQVGTALAVIDPDVINEGSGPVIVYSDLGMFRDSEVSGGFFPNNESLFLNTINFCVDNMLVAVTIDIKPDSDPNCFNNDGNGVIPVAILGSTEFDVRDIVPESIMLEGLAVKVVGKSNNLLVSFEDTNNDGYEDLVAKIEDSDSVYSEGSTTAILTGTLYNGRSFQGSDSICIVQ